MIALDPTQNAKLPRDVLLESCIQALVLPVNGNCPRHVYDILWYTIRIYKIELWSTMYFTTLWYFMISYMPEEFGKYNLSPGAYSVRSQQPFPRQILASYRRRCLDYNTNSVKKTLARLPAWHQHLLWFAGNVFGYQPRTETTWSNIFCLVDDPWLIPESAIWAWFACQLTLLKRQPLSACCFGDFSLLLLVH